MPYDEAEQNQNLTPSPGLLPIDELPGVDGHDRDVSPEEVEARRKQLRERNGGPEAEARAYAWARANISDEELEAAERDADKDGELYTTAEVLEYLRSL